MQGKLGPDYQSFENMPEENKTVSFFVSLAGNTNGAHKEIVSKLIKTGHREESLEKCDYCLVFCPVISRLETDLEDALDHAPAGKQIILVVMHHTWDVTHVICESRRLVTNANVHLTVDCLFYNQSLLKCAVNEKALHDMGKYFPQIQRHFGKTFLVIAVSVSVFVSVTILAAVFCKTLVEP